MPNGTEWHHLYEDFSQKAPRVLERLEECLVHLELLGTDSDAINCLQGSLINLHHEATRASIQGVPHHCVCLLRLLRAMVGAGRFGAQSFTPLRHCIELLAWQVELVDPRTGTLPLDDAEQNELLDRFAACAELEATDYRPATEQGRTRAPVTMGGDLIEFPRPRKTG